MSSPDATGIPALSSQAQDAGSKGTLQGGCALIDVENGASAGAGWGAILNHDPNLGTPLSVQKAADPLASITHHAIVYQDKGSTA
jgi:hypothetical protein